MELDLELAASFLSVVDEWSFAKAAEVLHVCPAAMTKRIHRLERQLGTTLVERGPGGIIGLTAAGVLFAADVRPLLQLARTIATRARSARDRDALGFGVPARSAQFLGLSEFERFQASGNCCPSANPG